MTYKLFAAVMHDKMKCNDEKLLVKRRRRRICVLAKRFASILRNQTSVEVCY